MQNKPVPVFVRIPKEHHKILKVISSKTDIYLNALLAAALSAAAKDLAKHNDENINQAVTELVLYSLSK